MPTPLRIAYLVSGDTQTGTYYRYHPLAAELVRQGHAVTVHSQHHGAGLPTTETERDGVRYRLHQRWRGDSWISPSLHPVTLAARWLDPLPPVDVCHLFQPWENAALLWLRERRRRCQRGALFAWDWDDLFHGGLFGQRTLLHRLRSRGLGWFERHLPARAGLVTTCSGYLAELARQHGARRTEVIHNGLVTPPPPPPRAQVRAQHRLPEQAFLLGFVGWTPTEVDWCLQALGQLDERVHLVCCGVPVHDTVARHPALAGRVHQVGTLPQHGARELMTALDAGLLPLAPTPFNQSRLPIKFADYLAAGLPVFSSDVGECGQMGRKLHGVVLLPPEPAAWAAGVAAGVRAALAGQPLPLPDPAQLHAQLDWTRLGAQLAEAYRAAGATRRDHV